MACSNTGRRANSFQSLAPFGRAEVDTRVVSDWMKERNEGVGIMGKWLVMCVGFMLLKIQQYLEHKAPHYRPHR